MTLQDYINLVTNSLSSYFNGKNSIVIPVIVALIIFLLGVVVATILRQLWVSIVKFLNLEKSLSGIEAYSSLVKASKNLSVTELLGNFIWWSIVLIFLLPALKALGLKEIDTVLGQFISYVPAAITAGLYLLFGAVFAWFANQVIFGVTQLTKISAATMIARLVSFAILVFSALLAVKALGVSEEMIRFIVIAAIAAFALAFGLAGKETASDILKKGKDLVK